VALRWIVARNPLYPLSAALLLFGINRLSTDVVLTASILARWLNGYWEPRIVAVTVGICLLAGPAYYLFDKTKTPPAGQVAIIGSFLLSGLGTIAALTRSLWNPSVSRSNE